MDELKSIVHFQPSVKNSLYSWVKEISSILQTSQTGTTPKTTGHMKLSVEAEMRYKGSVSTWSVVQRRSGYNQCSLERLLEAAIQHELSSLSRNGKRKSPRTTP